MLSFWVHSPMSFDKDQHLCNYLSNQATEYIHHLQNSLLPC